MTARDALTIDGSIQSRVLDVIALLTPTGGAGSARIRAETGLKLNQVGIALNSLRKKGRIHHQGSTHKSRWFLGVSTWDRGTAVAPPASKPLDADRAQPPTIAAACLDWLRVHGCPVESLGGDRFLLEGGRAALDAGMLVKYCNARRHSAGLGPIRVPRDEPAAAREAA